MYVVRVGFDADGKSIDSSVELEEERGEYDWGAWFARLASEAEIDSTGEQCDVRATFRVDVAHFAKP